MVYPWLHGRNRFNQIKQLQLTWKQTDFFPFPHDQVPLMPWLSKKRISQKTPVGRIRSEKLVLVGKVFFHPVGLMSFYKYYWKDRDQADASQPTWWGPRCFVLLDVKIKLKIIWLSIWLHHFCSFFFLQKCFKRHLWKQFSSVQFSHSVVSDSLRPHESQDARPPCPSPSPGLHSDSRPSNPWCHPAISSLVVPFSPAPNPSQHQSLFQWLNSSHEVAKVLELQLLHHSFQRNPRADLLQNGLVGSPCSPRDSQESSPTLQFKSINSLALSLLHSPTEGNF